MQVMSTSKGRIDTKNRTVQFHHEKNKKTDRQKPIRFLVVAGVGFEPHDLRVMSPTSYLAAPSRDMGILDVTAKVLCYYMKLRSICQLFFKRN